MFPLHVLTATSPFYEGMCESLIIPTVDGRYGVLSGHSDTICAVVPGELYIRLPSGEMRVAACAAGIMKVEKGDVLVLVDSAIRPEDIDKDRARRMADDAREQLLQKQSIEEYHAAQARLARALARLSVREKYIGE
ncbi:MAG TPA: ATP synthase F1 subunit epsilon [Candidatus Gallimonas gallistercoris]|uniref:ATP synthase epsilon chain n=1 Tax=Candidatus Gallimonas gallistercoris TaxID=2838602 RepID=A0A9D2H078_9FIRM|nr:ATP synthase F1 subunit epsilon [Candidatus Gallimonas gallistercoris]